MKNEFKIGDMVYFIYGGMSHASFHYGKICRILNKVDFEGRGRYYEICDMCKNSTTCGAFFSVLKDSHMFGRNIFECYDDANEEYKRRKEWFNNRF